MSLWSDTFRVTAEVTRVRGPADHVGRRRGPGLIGGDTGDRPGHGSVPTSGP